MSSQPNSIPPDVLIEHGAFVRSLARNLLADEHLADDIAQEAWLRYAEHPPRSAFDPRHWLAVVVRNLARNARRASEHRREHEARASRTEASGSLDDDFAQAATLRSVVDAVLALDEPYRGTVLARYFRDWEPSRIARETGVPLATVKSRLQRAHAQLRERLDREHGTRANWALALGHLAGLDLAKTSAGASGLGWASAVKVAGIAALCLVAATLAWRLATPRRAPENSLANSTSAPDDASEPAPVAAAADERRALDAAPPADVAAKFRVSGSVRDLAYQPLALAGGPARDIEVELRLITQLHFGGDLLASTKLTTDAKGAFAAELANPAQRPCYLVVTTARSDERRGSRVEVQIDAGVEWRADIELVRAAHGLLEGVVVDSLGEPVPNARLSLRSRSGETKARELVANERGELREPYADFVQSVDALDRGVVVLSFDAPVLLESGGSAGLRVVLARAASLSVRVVDAQGRGIEGMRVLAELDESEQRQVGQADSWDAPRNAGTTGADGRAQLEGVWADCKLQLSVSSDNENHQASSARGAELLFGDEGGAPIVLVPGEQREFVARWTGDLLLAGSTRSPNGDPLGDIAIEVTRDHQLHPDYVAPMARLRSAADGTFSMRLRPKDPSERLRIVAAERMSKAIKLQGLGYMGGGGPTDGAVGRLLLDTSAAVEGTLRADIVLEPTLTIAGRLLDADGQPITRSGMGGYRLWIATAGASSHRESGVGLGLPGSTFHPDGNFLFFGLTRGDWDVYVTKEIESFYTWESSVHVFPRTPAGAQGVELRLPREGEVRLRLRLHGGEPGGMTVLHGKLFPRDSKRLKEPAPRQMRVSGVTAWPVGAVLDFGGISGDVDARGTWSYGFYGTGEVREHALQPMGAGWYVFGVHPSSRDGSRRWSAQATSLAWYEPGDYAIDFELVPTTELSGRLLADARAEHLGVELRTLDGARVPLESLPGFAKPKYVLETDARGRFVMRHAPVGVFVLRAGSVAELERGEFRRELRVELVEGVNPAIELTLR